MSHFPKCSKFENTALNIDNSRREPTQISRNDTFVKELVRVFEVSGTENEETSHSFIPDSEERRVRLRNIESLPDICV